MAFEILNNFVELSLQFTTLGSLAIKAGDQAQTLSDSSIIKIGGAPVIPGSSLKGALRSNLESLLAAKGERVCVPHTAIPSKEDRAAYVQRLKRKLPCGPNDKDLCDVCRIFGTVGGNAGLSGSAIFLDARWADDIKYIAGSLGERMHVAIMRDTRSQSGGALNTLEVVDAGAHFAGSIRLINAEAWQLGALLHALDWLRQLGLGSKKTAGYGQVQVTVATIQRQTLQGGAWQASTLTEEACRQAFVARYEAKK